MNPRQRIRRRIRCDDEIVTQVRRWKAGFTDTTANGLDPSGPLSTAGDASYIRYNKQKMRGARKDVDVVINLRRCAVLRRRSVASHALEERHGRKRLRLSIRAHAHRWVGPGLRWRRRPQNDFDGT